MKNKLWNQKSRTQPPSLYKNVNKLSDRNENKYIQNYVYKAHRKQGPQGPQKMSSLKSIRIPSPILEIFIKEINTLEVKFIIDKGYQAGNSKLQTKDDYISNYAPLAFSVF